MDKELLRIVIIATGLIIIMGMLTWSYLRDKKAQEDMEADDDVEYGRYDQLSTAAVVVKVDDEPEPAEHHYFDQADAVYEPDDDDDLEPPPRAAVPAIIQFSLIAKADEGFNGIDLVNAFGIVGLEYGSFKIYERLDANRLVDFGVACMVEPGTFPDSNMDTFYCPGLVFFMQPGALDDAQAVFDDYIETIELLAIELDGVILDHHRQELTDAAILALRQCL